MLCVFPLSLILIWGSPLLFSCALLVEEMGRAWGEGDGLNNPRIGKRSCSVSGRYFNILLPNFVFAVFAEIYPHPFSFA